MLPEKDFFSLAEVAARWASLGCSEGYFHHLAVKDLLRFAYYKRDVGNHETRRETSEGTVITRHQVIRFVGADYRTPDTPVRFLRPDDARRVLEANESQSVLVSCSFETRDCDPKKGTFHWSGVHVSRDELVVTREERDRFERDHGIVLGKCEASTRPIEPRAPGALAFEVALHAIRQAGRSFERTPKSFRSLDEEALRDHLLSHLNVAFEGKAAGEVFRREGKTDICIENEQSGSAFIAECKVWKGESALFSGLDQLQRYLTWRDVNVAVVIFNKTTSAFTALQSKVKTAFNAHLDSIGSVEVPHVGEWRFTYRMKADPERHITVHVFAFNLHVARARAKRRR